MTARFPRVSILRRNHLYLHCDAGALIYMRYRTTVLKAADKFRIHVSALGNVHPCECLVISRHHIGERTPAVLIRGSSLIQVDSTTSSGDKHAVHPRERL